MSRNKREITAEIVNNNVDIYDVVSKYTILHPYRNGWKGLCPFHQEKTPSLHVKKDGAYKCFGCGKSGRGVISFIMDMEDLTFVQALEFIVKDLPSDVKKIIPKIQEKKILPPIEIEFVDCKFSDEHKLYWEKLEMDEKWLNKKNVFASCELAIGVKGNLKKMDFTKDEIKFVYYAEDIEKCKVLSIGPEVTKENKWRTNVPAEYLWYYNDYIDVVGGYDEGFTVKSVKDALVVQKLDRNAISTQNESAKTLLQYNVERINKIFKKNIMCYGTDKQGKDESIKITKETGWNWFNIENHLYEQFQCEDVSDYINLGFSYKTLERLLKNKGI